MSIDRELLAEIYDRDLAVDHATLDRWDRFCEEHAAALGRDGLELAEMIRGIRNVLDQIGG